jgi:hypothetical protein
MVLSVLASILSCCGCLRMPTAFFQIGSEKYEKSKSDEARASANVQMCWSSSQQQQHAYGTRSFRMRTSRSGQLAVSGTFHPHHSTLLTKRKSKPKASLQTFTGGATYSVLLESRIKAKSSQRALLTSPCRTMIGIPVPRWLMPAKTSTTRAPSLPQTNQL